MNSSLKYPVSGYTNAKIYVRSTYRGNAFASFTIKKDSTQIYSSGTPPNDTSGSKVLVNNISYDISNSNELIFNANDLGYNSNGGYVFDITIELS